MGKIAAAALDLVKQGYMLATDLPDVLSHALQLDRSRTELVVTAAPELSCLRR